MARHPFARVGCKFPAHVPTTNVFNISHIILKDKCTETENNEIVAKLFDMGCSTYKETNYPSAGGPSIPLFQKWYSDACVHFKEIWGWEAKKVENWWENVNLAIKPIIHFYNTPVSASEFEHAIKRCRRSDFVVVKLDIDNTNIEMKIMEVIERHADLVDELFFEYHYYFDDMNFGWGKLQNIKHAHNVTSAIQLMTHLRQKGIRAHFWV